MAFVSEGTGLIQTRVYEHLKKLILNHELAEEKIYSETKMAKELGISRSPLRHALQRLYQEGYINIFPSKGFKIRSLTYKDMKDTIQVRCAIESFCLYYITSTPDSDSKDELFATLGYIVAAMKEIMDNGYDKQRFIDLDHQFHLELVNYLGNQEFIEIFQRLIYLIDLTSSESLSIPGRMESTYQEHSTIYKNMIEGDVMLAYEVLQDHLNKPLELLKNIEK